MAATKKRGARQVRRRLAASERRERLLAAATTLFGRGGYTDSSIDAIAGAAGVTPPVLYDHFPSKLALYEAVLETHFANLRLIWGQFPTSRLSDESVAASFDAWFGYVEEDPEAARVLFREPSAPDAAAIHRVVSERSRDLLLPLLLDVPPGGSGANLEMLWVAVRGVLQGLALWWIDHREVERERIVATAFTALWTGYGTLLGDEASRGGS